MQLRAPARPPALPPTLYVIYLAFLFNNDGFAISSALEQVCT